MNSRDIELTARTAFLEFLLEAGHTQFAVQYGSEAFAELRDKALDAIRFDLTVTGDSGDSDIDLAVQNKMIEIAEKFFARVETKSKAEESKQQG